MNVNAKRDNSRIKEIEIMDCTLRDGEQTNGVSFLPHEKLMIARMLLHDINVDRIEVASARVSEGEKDAVARICRYGFSYAWHTAKPQQHNQYLFLRHG